MDGYPQSVTQNTGCSQIVSGPRSVERMNQHNLVSLFMTSRAASVFAKAILLCVKVGKELGFVAEGSDDFCRLMLCTISEEDTTCFRIEFGGPFFDCNSRFPAELNQSLKVQPINQSLKDIGKRNLQEISISVPENQSWCQFSQTYQRNSKKLTSFRFIDSARGEVKEPVIQTEGTKHMVVSCSQLLKVLDQVAGAMNKGNDDLVIDVMTATKEIVFRNGVTSENDTTSGTMTATLAFSKLDKEELGDQDFTKTLSLKMVVQFARFCQFIGGGQFVGIGQMTWYFSEDDTENFTGGPCLIHCKTLDNPNTPPNYCAHIDTYLIQTTEPKAGVAAPPPKPRTQASQKTQNTQQPVKKERKIRRAKTAAAPPSPPKAEDFDIPDMPMPSQIQSKRVRFSVTQNSPAAANNGDEVRKSQTQRQISRSQTEGAASQGKSPMQEIPQNEPFDFPPTPGQSFATQATSRQRFSVSRGNAVRNSEAGTQNPSSSRPSASQKPLASQAAVRSGDTSFEFSVNVDKDAAKSQDQQSQEDDGLTEEQRQEQRERELEAQKRADEIRIGSLPSFDVNVPDFDVVMPPSPEIHGSQPAKQNGPSMLYNFAPTPEGTQGVRCCFFFVFEHLCNAGWQNHARARHGCPTRRTPLRHHPNRQ